MDDEMRAGRALLIEAGKTGQLPQWASAEHRRMTHALGGLETAGIYVDQKLMPPHRFIIVWHNHLRAMRVGAELMAKERTDQLEGWWPWPHLWPLFDAAAEFHDEAMVCCRHQGRWPAIEARP